MGVWAILGGSDPLNMSVEKIWAQIIEVFGRWVSVRSKAGGTSSISLFRVFYNLS